MIMKKSLLSIFAAALVICLTACGAPKDSSDTAAAEEYKEHDKSPGYSIADPSEPYYKTDEDTFAIETPYGVLKYPSKWKDCLRAENYQNGNAHVVLLYAVLDGNDIPLYSVIFGQSEEGTPLGEVKNNEEAVQVHLVDHFGETALELSEELQMQYDQMREDINVLISKLVYESDMTLY